MEVTVSFDVKNDEGKNFANITATYSGVQSSSVAHMEGLLVDGFLKPLVSIAQGS